MYPSIELDPKQHKRFVSGHPWVYANELIQSYLTRSLEPGSIVILQLHKKPLALGYYNRHSLIAFRELTRNIHAVEMQTDETLADKSKQGKIQDEQPFQKIDATFFIERFQKALKLRQYYYSKPFYRLIHAEVDGLPGLIIDRFEDIFIVQINTYGMELLKPFIIEALNTEFEPRTIYFKNDSSARKLEGLPEKNSELIGEEIKTMEVIENSLTYLIDFSHFQKTGWFYDHRENRKKIRKLAKDKSVIDYFCYSGGFALQAAYGEAAQVIAVDASSQALENAKRSAEHLRLSAPIEFVCDQAFTDMDDRIARNESFDIVILDPPAFVKVKKDFNVGLKGYEKLINKGLQLLNPDGFLLIASCSYHVKLEDLKLCLNRALFKNNRRGKIVETLHAGPDHPAHPNVPESEYLKGFIVNVES